MRLPPFDVMAGTYTRTFQCSIYGFAYLEQSARQILLHAACGSRIGLERHIRPSVKVPVRPGRGPTRLSHQAGAYTMATYDLLYGGCPGEGRSIAWR